KRPVDAGRHGGELRPRLARHLRRSGELAAPGVTRTAVNKRRGVVYLTVQENPGQRPWTAPGHKPGQDLLHSEATVVMFILRPSDLVSVLSKTGPISVEDLVTRTGTNLSELARDLDLLIDRGDVEVEGGKKDSLKEVLSQFQKRRNEEAISFRPGSV